MSLGAVSFAIHKEKQPRKKNAAKVTLFEFIYTVNQLDAIAQQP